MVEASDPFLGVCRISAGGFAAALRERPANPALLAERDPTDYWDECRCYGVDPLFVLAMFQHESQMGTAGTAIQTHSWGNTRSPSFGAVQVDEVAGRSGTFPCFFDWLDGVASTAGRLSSPIWPQAAPYGARRSIRAVFEHPSGAVWAPGGDLNDPNAYLASMLALMNRYGDQGDEHIEATYPPAPPVRSMYMTHSFWVGRDGHLPRAIVLHITAGASAASAYNWWAAAFTGDNAASAHYIVDRDGSIWCCVRERDAAWTNGILNQPNMHLAIIRRWVAGGISPNKESITIECAGYSDMAPNANPDLNGYSEAQYASLGMLLPALSARHGIDLDGEHLIGHKDIDSVNRKNCPGLSQAEWDRLFQMEANVTDGGPFATANEAYDAWTREHGETVVWAGAIAGRAHWYGQEPQSIARTNVARLLAYDGAYAHDCTGHALDDWESLTAPQLTIF